MGGTLLLQALAALDPSNSDHWTADGLPRLDAIEAQGVKATRQEVTEAAPNFTRQNPVVPNDSEQGAGDQDEEKLDGKDGSEEQEGPEPEEQQLEGRAAAEKEYADARANIDAAQRRFKKAQEELDAYIEKEEAARTNRTTMADIQAFQKAQFEQRRKQIEGK